MILNSWLNHKLVFVCVYVLSYEFLFTCVFVLVFCTYTRTYIGMVKYNYDLSCTCFYVFVYQCNTHGVIQIGRNYENSYCTYGSIKDLLMGTEREVIHFVLCNL